VYCGALRGVLRQPPKPTQVRRSYRGLPDYSCDSPDTARIIAGGAVDDGNAGEGKGVLGVPAGM